MFIYLVADETLNAATVVEALRNPEGVPESVCDQCGNLSPDKESADESVTYPEYTQPMHVLKFDASCAAMDDKALAELLTMALFEGSDEHLKHQINIAAI